jgi:predicted nucleic acid-binding protein
VTVLYGDPSAIAGAYFSDESGHADLRNMLLLGDEPVIMSEIGRIEVASAIVAARRADRITDSTPVLSRFEADCRPGGPLKLLALRSSTVMARAHQLVIDHPLRALDAIHLAVALEDGLGLAGDDGLAFVTRDRAQAAAAVALGFEVR